MSTQTANSSEARKQMGKQEKMSRNQLYAQIALVIVIISGIVAMAFMVS